MSLEERITRIEKILHDHDLHEDDCPVRRAQKHNALGRTYMRAESCDCWIMEGM